MSSRAHSTSSGVSSALAPLTMMIALWDSGSTKIGATPEVASVRSTCFVLMPWSSKFFSVDSAKTSFPTRVTMTISAPRRAAAIAWLAPFPPHPMANPGASTVSPSEGMRWM